MSKRHSRHWLLLSALVAACGSDSTSPPPPDPIIGSIAVSITTTGSDPTPYLYGIDVASPQDGVHTLLMVSQERQVVVGLRQAPVTVALSGLPSNCSTETNPRTVLISSPDTIEVTFALTCGPADPVAIALAFSAHRETVYEDLYRMNRDGTGLVQLTSNTAANSLAPAWSPDGTRILFFDVINGDYQLRVMNRDGSGLIALALGLQPSSATWSPDGSRLAFFSPDSLWIINADGTGLVAVPSPPYSLNPSWSPDGLRLTFEVPSGIGLMNADGTGLSLITLGGALAGRYPTWSPGGGKIAFDRFPTSGCYYSCPPLDDLLRLTIMDDDGTNVLNLAQGGGSGRFSWSPDGTRLAFQRDSLSILNSDGSGVVTLSMATAGWEGPPNWAADGSGITFIANNEIYAVRTNGTGLTRRSRRSMLGFFAYSSPSWRPGAVP